MAACGMRLKKRSRSPRLPNEPNLIYELYGNSDRPFADLKVIVRNSTGVVVRVQDVRLIDASKGSVVDLGTAG